MKTTQIRIDMEVKKLLVKRSKPAETFNDILRRLFGMSCVKGRRGPKPIHSHLNGTSKR